MEEALRRVRKATDQSMDVLVNTIVEEAVRLTESTMGYFAVTDKAPGLLIMLGWSKSAMEVCEMTDQPIEYPIEATGIWGDCIRERKAIITNDYPGCTRVTKKGYPEGHVPVQRHMNVPVILGEQIMGILGVGNRTEEYTAEDAARLQSFANAAWPIYAEAKKGDAA
jgi:GAF domain-containing protein